MREIKIPNERERFCSNCSRIDENHMIHEKTLQKPVSIEVYDSGSGCFRSRKTIEWKWECQECGEVNF